MGNVTKILEKKIPKISEINFRKSHEISEKSFLASATNLRTRRVDSPPPPPNTNRVKDLLIENFFDGNFVKNIIILG